MKQRLIDRLIWWFCDTFGHRKSGSCNTEYQYLNKIHYPCQRCRRMVVTAKPAGGLAEKGKP